MDCQGRLFPSESLGLVNVTLIPHVACSLCLTPQFSLLLSLRYSVSPAVYVDSLATTLCTVSLSAKTIVCPPPSLVSTHRSGDTRAKLNIFDSRFFMQRGQFHTPRILQDSQMLWQLHLQGCCCLPHTGCHLLYLRPVSARH